MADSSDWHETTPEVFSCGFLITRQHGGQRQFLLMQHRDRWDLPKGHVDEGESRMECALRELWEETGISVDQIRVDRDFEYRHRYLVTNRRGRTRLKELTIFLAELLPGHEDFVIQHTEHLGSRWFDWQPRHQIEPKTVDSLLQAVAVHWNR